jgi:CBS domain-containing protein
VSTRKVYAVKAREIMTSNVVSVDQDSTIEDAARLLARHHISGLPVVSGTGALVGLVTEHDLIAKSGRTVGDIMSRSVISVSADTEVEQVAHLLTNQRIRRVPVMEGDKLVGILSRSDLVRQIAMSWVCSVCGETVRSPKVPQQCPACHSPESAFTHRVDYPGM